MGDILDAIQGIYDFLVNGSYTFVQEIFAQITLWIMVWYFKAKAAALVFLWGVGQAMLDQLNISGLINQYWGQLDSGFLGFITRYKIPEALNLVLNAHLTKFLWRMMS